MDAFRILALISVLAALPHSARAQIHPWDVFEIEMTARQALANPYLEALPDSGAPFARVVLTGVSGDAQGKRYAITAFWDGGQTWKARFAPPAPGAWRYESSSADPGLSGIRGSLTCTRWTEAELRENPARRGAIRVAKDGPRAGRYFEYADGTPFLWIGDTWWNWAKKGIHFATFQKLVDDRAEKGFTVGQLFVSGDALLDSAGSHPDLEQIRKVEQMVAYANSRGITVWIHPWWSGRGFRERVGAEKARRWWRYVVQRFGAYHVIWTLAGEYNMDNYGGMGLQFWKDLGAMIRSEDPYQRLISAHPTPPLWQGGAEAPQWSTGEVLHLEPWLDYNQSQVGHSKSRNEMIPQVVSADYARRPAKPVVVTEPWYEFIDGNPAPEEIRFGAWSAILSGAAGHSYGGGHIWWAHVPEAPMAPSPWPMHREFDTDTLNYPGAMSMSFMAKFLRGIEWWKLEPHPELISDYPVRFCAAVPGKEYVAYVRWGGALEIDLRAATGADKLSYEWIDLGDRKVAGKGEVPGGAIREFRSPEDFPRFPHSKDWLLHITGRR